MIKTPDYFLEQIEWKEQKEMKKKQKGNKRITFSNRQKKKA